MRRGLLLCLGILSLCVESVGAVDTIRLASTLNLPMDATSPPGDFERLFIAEFPGRIQILNLLTGELNAEPFLDISSQVLVGGERGFHGVAFHPNYSQNGYFFVKYANLDGNLIVSRFSVDPSDPNRADPASEVVLLDVFQGTIWHKGGNLEFGPFDGYLYVPFGDGGWNGDAQAGAVLRGKILRINVDELPYTIPPDNPFIGANDPNDEFRDEIYHYGVRNPFRITFDRETGDLYIGDVGWNDEEEVDFWPGTAGGGANFGWNCMEGLRCTGLGGCECNDNELSDPILRYTHAPQGGAAAVIGGSVYRGEAIPELWGVYFYGDHTVQKMYSFTYNGTSLDNFTDRTPELQPSNGEGQLGKPVAFIEDNFGEMYVIDHGGGSNGEIYKIIPDDIASRDCNGNYIVDTAEIAVGVASDCNGNGIVDACDIAAGTLTDSDGDGVADECQFFSRGDVNNDGTIGLGDPILALNHLFSMTAVGCQDSIDYDDSGTLNLGDPVGILLFQFSSGPPPAAPFPDCGTDPTDDALLCSGGCP